MKLKLNLFLFSIVLGVLLFFRPIFFLFLILIACLSLFLMRIPYTERRPLVGILIIASIMRFFFGCIAIFYVFFNYLEAHEHPLLYKFIGHTLNIVRDYHREILNGISTSHFFQETYGKISITDLQNILNVKDMYDVETLFFIHAGTYFQGILNFFFNSPLLNIFIYSIISLWICILMYYLAKEIFNRKVALWSSALIAILPTFTLWSCINIRMSISIIAMLLSVWSLIKFSKQNHIKYVLTLGLAIFLFSLAKERFFIPLSLISLVCLFLALRVNPFIKVICVGMVLVFSHHFQILQSKAYPLIRGMASNQVGFHSYAESKQNYKIYDPKIYERNSFHLFKPSFKEVVKALPKGMLYFLFSPFSMDNASKLFFYPFRILTYFVFALAMIGFFLGFYSKFRETGIVFLFSLLWIVLLSLAIGNIGAAIRHRDLILPFYYIFAIAAICHMLNNNIMKKTPA